MDLPRPHSRNLRTHRVRNVPDTFFITKCLHPRKLVLNRALRQHIVSAFDYAVRNERIMLGAFVVMPDHWHAVFGLRGEWTLPRFMHSFMSFIGAKTTRSLRVSDCAWQEGYYDTRIRSMKQFGFVVDYIVQNPVRKGLVREPSEWDATSVSHSGIITEPWPWLFEQDFGGSRH